MNASTADGTRAARPAEFAVVAALFAFAWFEFLRVDAPVGSAASRVTAAVLFAVLAGGYLGFSLEAVRRWVHQAVSPGLSRELIGPASLLAFVALHVAVSGAPATIVLSYAAYLVLPVVFLSRTRHAVGSKPARLLAVAVLLWLPVELLLPRLPVGGALNATHLAAMVTGLYCFLIVEPLDGIGYDFLLRRTDWASAVAALLPYLCVAVPIGLLTGFVVWNPQLTVERLLVTPGHIYLAIAVPEEFLFRGLIQNLLVRWLGVGRGVTVAAIVFGLAHLPDVRYALLATLAGVAYGYVYQRTRRVTASAVTHAAVDWIWVLVFQRSG